MCPRFFAMLPLAYAEPNCGMRGRAFCRRPWLGLRKPTQVCTCWFMWVNQEYLLISVFGPVTGFLAPPRDVTLSPAYLLLTSSIVWFIPLRPPSGIFFPTGSKVFALILLSVWNGFGLRKSNIPSLLASVVLLRQVLGHRIMVCLMADFNHLVWYLSCC